MKNNFFQKCLFFRDVLRSQKNRGDQKLKKTKRNPETVYVTFSSGLWNLKNSVNFFDFFKRSLNLNLVSQVIFSIYPTGLTNASYNVTCQK